MARFGGAAAWPLPALAQQKLPTIGLLGASTPANWSQWTAVFVQRLRELGWVDGRTVAIEYRWAEGRSERYIEIADEFTRLKVNVIVTVGSAVPEAKQVAMVIPIVFAAAVDPVGAGLDGCWAAVLQHQSAWAAKPKCLTKKCPTNRAAADKFKTDHTPRVRWIGIIGLKTIATIKNTPNQIVKLFACL